MKFPFTPKVIGWELTLRCNMQCIHCGSSAGPARENELTLEEGLDLCDRIISLGCEVLTLSGGEPLLHPHWDAYAKRLGAGGVKVFMITNGLVLEKNLERILASPLRRIGISLDGAESTHNFIRRNPHSFQTALNAAKTLKKHGLSVGSVTHISKKNIGEMEEMYEIFKQIPLDFWQIQITFLSGRMLDFRDMALEPEDMPRIAEFIEEKAKEGVINITPGDNLGYYSSKKIASTPWKGCFAGRHLMGIDADGAVKGCLSLPREFVEDTVRNRPLREIWEDPNLFRYNRYFDPDNDLGEFCKECEFALNCRGGCTVTAYSATGRAHNNPYCLHRVEKNATR